MRISLARFYERGRKFARKTLRRRKLLFGVARENVMGEVILD